MPINGACGSIDTRIKSAERRVDQIDRGKEELIAGENVFERICQKMSVTKTKLRVWLKLLKGTLRRLFWNVCRPGYVRASLAQRLGECRRCGTCCRLLWRCPYFHDDDGIPSCRLYTRYRPPNCSNFPIDHRDLADRDLVSPNEPCGFSWARKDLGSTLKNQK